MTWLIVRKELLANLLSLRFALGLGLSAVMMGIAGYILLADYAARHQTYLAAVQEHQEALQQAKVYSTIAVTVDIPPSPLSIFSRGANDLPTAIRVSPYVIPSISGGGAGGSGIYLGGNSNRPYNPLLRVFSSIDLVFVVSTILSLFALLLVFDSFSGEREQGTLPLLMTCPVGRLEVLAGKFLAALITVAVPLAVGFVEVLLLWSLSPDVEVDAAVVGSLGVLFFLSLVFLAAFLGLGLLVSLYVRDSSTGLMYLLLAWVLIAVVIPEGGGALAQYFRPRESRRRIVEDAARVRREVYDAYQAIPYEQKGSHRYMNSDDLSGESLLSTTEEEVHNLVEYNRRVYPLKYRFAETSYRVVEQYEMALRQWGRLRDSMVSPTSAFSFAVEEVTGGGLPRLQRFIDNAVRFRQGVFQAILEADREDPQSEHRYVPWNCGSNNFSRGTVDLGPAKEFRDPSPKSAEGLQSASVDLALLILYNGVLFLAVFRAFVRQDITPGSAL